MLNSGLFWVKSIESNKKYEVKGIDRVGDKTYFLFYVWELKQWVWADAAQFIPTI